MVKRELSQDFAAGLGGWVLEQSRGGFPAPGLYNNDDSTKLKPAMEHFFLLQYKQHTTVFAPHTHVDGKTFSSFVTQVMVPIFDYYLASEKVMGHGPHHCHWLAMMTLRFIMW